MAADSGNEIPSGASTEREESPREVDETVWEAAGAERDSDIDRETTELSSMLNKMSAGC